MRIQRSPKESEVDFVNKIIRLRCTQTGSVETRSHNPPTFPAIEMPMSVVTLLIHPELWFYPDGVDSERFVYWLLPRLLIMRRAGEKVNNNEVSAFLLRQRHVVREKWGIEPLAISSSQELYQFWDELLMRAIFTNIILDAYDPDPRVNKIAYTLDPSVQLYDFASLQLHFLNAMRRRPVLTV